MRRTVFAAVGAALALLLCIGCDGTQAAASESRIPSVPDPAETAPPSAGGLDADARPIPTEPSTQSAGAYRLVFPAARVFACGASYSPAEGPACLSKDQVENGRVSYEESLVPFSDILLEHPDASLLMLGGVHECLLESREVRLNDGWLCYLYRSEMNHAAGSFDPGGEGRHITR